MADGGAPPPLTEPSSGERARQHELIAVSAAFCAMSTIALAARMYSRHFIVCSVGVDDWFMISGWLFAIGYLIMIALGVTYGMGLHGTAIAFNNMIDILKDTLAIEVIYYFAIYAIKMSILFQYLRFAVTRKFRILCVYTMAILSIFIVICFIVTMAQCIPLKEMWDLLEAVEGKCINTTAFFYNPVSHRDFPGTSGFNIVTDIWIIGLPIRTLSSIQRPNREKLALFVVFGMGVFSCVASIVRLHTIYQYTLSSDPFYDSVQVNLWSMIEINIAIACASIPSLKPLVSKAARVRTRQARSGPSTYDYSKDATDFSSSAESGTVPGSPGSTQQSPWATAVSSPTNVFSMDHVVASMPPPPPPPQPSPSPPPHAITRYDSASDSTSTERGLPIQGSAPPPPPPPPSIGAPPPQRFHRYPPDQARGYQGGAGAFYQRHAGGPENYGHQVV
ncbi:hypothetical protein BDY21DRAFT_362619 [Lineolata rhizophorae]|uniref:Rhodopsin domain-containing protein n=1 Tax=Lineolata rhizophorae TaxID=578093 RepID=A0A6A6P544_9PEZI|nr:hypothetical protein BDY21DRAFT_362619 [Lineolata rhizophorae]